MKMPQAPPTMNALLREITQDPERAARLLGHLSAGGPAPNGKYRHWDVLRHLSPPSDLTPEEWWLTIKFARLTLRRRLPATDRHGVYFAYAIVDTGLSMLHEIDRQASGAIKGSDQVTDPQTRDTYLIKTLFEEAITSSQLEGASTTREVAKEMLQRGRPPRDRSERMIYNNYQAMQFIRRVRGQLLTPSIIFELHGILTDGTLNDESATGRFRRPDELIHVVDELGHTLHVPPDALELPDRLQRLCDFANAQDEAAFIHPVVRAIVLHFWLAYDHPFVDGNGRTARALFYWCMAMQGYWLCEFISISRIIKKAPAKYSRAFLYSETDDNDVTYFVLNQLRVTVRAIRALHTYLERKSRELQETREFFKSSTHLHAMMNHRQLAVVNHATKNPNFVYSIQSHRRSHGVSYQTARTDLLYLSDNGLLERGKNGKAFIFIAPADLRSRLERLPKRKRRSKH